MPHDSFDDQPAPERTVHSGRPGLMVRPPALIRMFGTALKAWYADNAARLGASIAYYTLFSLAPVLLVAIGIAGMVFRPEDVQGRVAAQLAALLGTEGARAVQAMLEGARNREAGVFATIVGGVTFLLASTGAFMELQNAFNQIWRVKPKDGAGIRDFIMQRLVSFGLVVAIGFLLLVALVVSAALSALAEWINSRAPGLPFVWRAFDVVLSLSVITVLFAILYRVLPDVKLRWGDVWAGAAATALLFTIGKFLIGLYLGRSSTTSSYGAAGSVVIVLLWVYYTSQVVLLGAEFTRVYTRRERSKPQPADWAERCAGPGRRRV